MSFQPIGRAFALVQPNFERQPLKSDLIKQSEDQGEVIKVRLSLTFLIITHLIEALVEISDINAHVFMFLKSLCSLLRYIWKTAKRHKPDTKRV